MKGPMRSIIDKVSGTVTAATRRQDKINRDLVSTMEANTTEQGAAPPENQENEQQTKKRDCKPLFVPFYDYD